MRELLARSDDELVAADLAGTAEERFVHGHLAALRAGAAVVAAFGRPGRRRAPGRSGSWSPPRFPSWPAGRRGSLGAAPLRAAVETGRAAVDDARADRAVAEASGFADAVRSLLDAGAQGGLRAS